MFDGKLELDLNLNFGIKGGPVCIQSAVSRVKTPQIVKL